MTTLDLKQTYRLNGKETVYLPVNIASGLFLCDLNKSKSWETPGGRQGHRQGFLVTGDRLAVYAFDIADGRVSERIEPQPTRYTVRDLIPCGVEEIKYDLARWGPGEENE